MPSSREVFEAYLARMEPEMRKALLEAFQDIRSSAQLSLVIGHLERGDIEAAIAALNLRPEFLAPLDDALGRAFLEGGRQALLALPVLTNPFTVAVWLCASRGATSGRNGG